MVELIIANRHNQRYSVTVDPCLSALCRYQLRLFGNLLREFALSMTDINSVLDQPGVEKLRGLVPSLRRRFSRIQGSGETMLLAHTRSVRGLETESISRGLKITVDEPESVGGTNKGPNPMELLLASLGTCQEIVIVAHAAELGIELAAVGAEVSGMVDGRGVFSSEGRATGFASIHCEVEIVALQATMEQLEALKTIALTRCPVLSTREKGVTITHEFDLVSLPQRDPEGV